MPKLKELSLKQKVFIDKTLETLSPTEGAMVAYDVKKRTTASAIATENLSKPTIREEILRRLEEKEVNVDTSVGTLKRNIKQSKNYAASNTALDMFFNLTESYPTPKTINTNININLAPEALKERKEALEEELNRIRE